jgi:hypothetical protein
VAYVLFNSWAGRTKARVTILKTGPKRSKVRFEQKAFWRPVGHVQYVPNHAIERISSSD